MYLYESALGRLRIVHRVEYFIKSTIGVKQGFLIFPTLFGIYRDELESFFYPRAHLAWGRVTSPLGLDLHPPFCRRRGPLFLHPRGVIDTTWCLIPFLLSSSVDCKPWQKPPRLWSSMGWRTSSQNIIFTSGVWRSRSPLLIHTEVFSYQGGPDLVWRKPSNPGSTRATTPLLLSSVSALRTILNTFRPRRTSWTTFIRPMVIYGFNIWGYSLL